MTRAALDRLLAAMRRRLWLARIVRGAVAALWWIAASVLALGLVHRYGIALHTEWVGTLALGPAALGVLVVALRSRPSQAEAAALADRLCGARELIVSAADLALRSRRAGARAEPSAAERIVLHRAERLARAARPALPASAGAPRARSAVLATALAAAGAFLLANPSLAPPSTAAPASSSDGLPADAAPPPTLTPELAAAEARARLVTEEPSPGGAEPLGREPTPLLIPQLRAGVAAGTPQETGQLAATARASARPDGRAEPVAMEVRRVRAAPVDSAAQAAAGSGGVPLAADAPTGGSPATGAGHRNAAGAPTALNRFAPAERRYVAEYFATQADRGAEAATGE